MNKKILIVRGDTQNAKALSFLLAGSGYQISTHHSASEAIDAVRHQRFDLAITDELLPENQPDLGLVAGLKEAQPNLPVLYITQEKTVESIIGCIRAGASEIIENSADLKTAVETTNHFFKSDELDSLKDEVTWNDILEVERLLENSVCHDSEARPSKVTSAEVEQSNAKLEAALKERDKLAGELADCIAQVNRSKALIEELKRDNGNATTDSEVIERSADLDDRERKLKEMTSRLSQQKFEVESQLAELEAQKIEFEEAQKDAGAEISNEALDQERADFTSQRLEYQATIQDLEREIAVVKSQNQASPAMEAELNETKAKIQDLQEIISQKDFLIEQRDRELAEAKELASQTAGNPEVEELEDAKRLVEIERHKLQERIDQLELEKRLFDESHSKSQKEIQVERRDAEISLRELQNTIKEEQLKLKVEQSALREELRQFEQARTNFQEDVQELQSKQSELRKLEAYLNQMERSIKENGAISENALPKPDSATALEPLEPISAESSDKIEAPSTQSNGEPKKPDDWGKPNMEKKAGRGPLRIGRRSSF